MGFNIPKPSRLKVLETKSAEQGNENISRLESFKKGKEKLIGERQKAY